MDFKNKISLVTGASRGIGASVARQFAERGADVVINFRSKGPRAESVAKQIQQYGRQALLAQADLTQPADLENMAELVSQTFGRLDVLILNASGGLEKDKPTTYAMELNLTAQMQTVDHLLPLMPAGGSIVFVTSHWGHFHGQHPVLPVYEPIAASKKKGEDALRARIPEFTSRGINLYIVSGDIIEGTITPKLLERTQPGLIEVRREYAGSLPTVEEFAKAIVDAAADTTQPSGHTTFVGPTE
jgi:NAD(P)-dependent dehydrogenase (short-subunit alcohol dehydrogenase family)